MVAVCLAIMLLSDSLYGQHAMVTQDRWWTADVQRELRLTSTQVETLNGLFERDLPERLAAHRTIKEMDRLLERTLERGNAADEHVARLSAHVEALRAQQNVRRSLMLLAMYRTLTYEQRAALTQKRRARRDGPAANGDRRPGQD
jgi:Spy/CpxP family protein refolding chaperone